MENQECYNPNIGGSKLAFPLKYLGQGETFSLETLLLAIEKSSVLAQFSHFKMKTLSVFDFKAI